MAKGEPGGNDELEPLTRLAVAGGLGAVAVGVYRTDLESLFVLMVAVMRRELGLTREPRPAAAAHCS